jgi:hypothetical protein
MHADDVILLSETSEELQNCLDKLHKYCEVWGVQVNIKNTKSMIFNNTLISQLIIYRRLHFHIRGLV